MAGQTQPIMPPCIWPSSSPGVTLLIQGESLAASMSDYLITQLKATPASESGSEPELPAAMAKAAWKP